MHESTRDVHINCAAKFRVAITLVGCNLWPTRGYRQSTCLLKLPNSPDSFHGNTVFGVLQFKVTDHHKRINCLHCPYQPMLMFLYLWHLWFLLVQGHHLMYVSVCGTVTWPVAVSVTWPVSVYLCHHSFGLYLYVCHSHMACVTSRVTVLLACICLSVALLPGLCHCLCHHSSGLYLSACVTVTQPVSLSVSLTHLAFMKSQQASLTSCRWRKLAPTRRDWTFLLSS